MTGRPRIVKRAFKYRFYPTPEQAQVLCRTLGCVRLVYNKGLEARTRAYCEDGRRMSYGDSSAALTGWKGTSELALLMLEYKCAWYGRDLVVIGRWFPSSKRCSDCGTVRDTLPLHVRTWTCDTCGVVHDRDVNAARNILAAGLAERGNACGADVRPHSGTSILGRGGRC